ncbi:MAG: MCE family protein [Bacteroidetes bacterium]|nr:MCE family protein [Bacteroidota bacterium]
MKNNNNHQLKLGILITAGLLFFVVSVYLLGKQQNMFSSDIKVKAHFTNIKGLQVGNNVRFSGINIGTVTDIHILNDSVIEVEMAIEKEVTKFIKKDSKVEISNDGLMGNKLITINPGNRSTLGISEGDELLSKNKITSDELLEETKNIIMTTKTVAGNLKEITEKLNNGNGDFSKLLNEDEITSNLKKVSGEMVGLSSDLRKISYKINNGHGDIGRLLNEDGITRQANEAISKLDSIAFIGQQTMNNLHKTSVEINEGNGVINKLIYDTVLSYKLDTTMVKLNQGIDEAKQAASTIDNSWILNVFSKKDKKRDK